MPFQFEEDRIYRHLEPALAFQLEISRLNNFTLEAIPVEYHRIYLYLARSKNGKDKYPVNNSRDVRFFVRSIIRHSELMTREASYEYMRNTAERTLLEALDAIEVGYSHPEGKNADCNHIFLNFLPTLVTVDPWKVADTARDFVIRYGHRLWKLRVLQAELKFIIRPQPGGKTIQYRLFISNESGYLLDVALYQEVTDMKTGLVMFECLGPGNRKGPLHGMLVNTPYPKKDKLQLKRLEAQKLDTTYVYDFPALFHRAHEAHWMESTGKEAPAESFRVTELVLDSTGRLAPVTRHPAENTCGMVAWQIKMITPECQSGRDIVVIANDLTYAIGSFATKEDELYKKASEYARELGVPRIYIAANSGARIGLAEEIKKKFHVAWNDPEYPENGFKYLYLTEEDIELLREKFKDPENTLIHSEKIEEDGETRYVIKDVIGAVEGLGVENLRGSGMIAGETAIAYDDIVTISLVTCRAIGIGAYLVRLGQRVVQVENSHLILTGANALNKLLGRDVYTSNNQLGGIQIMANNGVTHAVVPDDYAGVRQVFIWLNFIPAKKGATLPISPRVLDPVDRLVEFCPPEHQYDPRCLLAGKGPDAPSSNRKDVATPPNRNSPTQGADKFLRGLCDVGSFHEILSGWAKTVVTGRARLGGIPIGVISVETRTVEVEIPADPANLSSEAIVNQQAGQVWFPDSAYKTSQAIEDFNKEELPLLILANWRGFSGGMKDMYDQVLKFGAMIVTALAKYQQPVIVYLPPHSELRGGAWVVIDPTINANGLMEMYADPTSRGGVLEPEGIVEIKFRKKDLSETMNRNDTVCKQLLDQIAKTETVGSIPGGIDQNPTSRLSSPSTSMPPGSLSGTTPPLSTFFLQQQKEMQENAALKKECEQKLNNRHENLASAYHAVAVEFADLHDRCGRMLAKDVIKAVVEWKEARRFFYGRFRRLIAENRIVRMIREADSDIKHQDARQLVKAWFCSANDGNKNVDWELGDSDVAQWLEGKEGNDFIREKIRNSIEKNALIGATEKAQRKRPELSLEMVKTLLKNVTPDQRSELIELLSKNE